MAVIEITTIFGVVKAQPMRLVDIHDVQPMADEESIENSESNTLATAASVQDPEQDTEQ